MAARLSFVLRSFVVAPTLLLMLACGSSPAAAPRAASDARCAVWNREISFAKSVENHDPVAFAAHVHPGAVFVEGTGDMAVGREAIVASWRKIVAGEGLKLFWRPTSVVPTGAPDVLLSRGPFWIEFTKQDAPQHYMTGSFQSVWTRDTDGEWRVLIDGGPAPPPAPATEEEIERVKATIPAHCPPSAE